MYVDVDGIMSSKEYSYHVKSGRSIPGRDGVTLRNVKVVRDIRLGNSCGYTIGRYGRYSYHTHRVTVRSVRGGHQVLVLPPPADS